MAVKIVLIHSDKCEKCDYAEKVIQKAIKEVERQRIKCSILKMIYSNKKAIDIAIDHDIEEIPACVIGSKVFVGTDFYVEEIKNAIVTASKAA